MVYFLETEISNNQNSRKSLKSVFGIGQKKTNLICKKIGIAKNSKISDLSNSQLNNISQYVLNSEILITNNLKKEKILSLQRLVNIKSVRGLRKIKGLPVRGQRTHTNARTASKFKR